MKKTKSGSKEGKGGDSPHQLIDARTLCVRIRPGDRLAGRRVYKASDGGGFVWLNSSSASADRRLLFHRLTPTVARTLHAGNWRSVSRTLPFLSACYS